MGGTLFIVLFIGGGVAALALLIAAIVGLLWFFSRRRQQATLAAAAQLGLQPVEALPLGFGDPQWLIRGHQGRLQAISIGEHAGHPLAVLESAFSARTPRGARIVEQTVVALHAPGRALPWVVIAPRGWSPAQRSMVHLDQQKSAVPLPSGSPLAQHYQVYSPSPGAAARLLSEPLVQALAAQPGWWLEARGAVAFASRLDTLVPPAKLPKHVARATHLLGALLLQ